MHCHPCYCSWLESAAGCLTAHLSPLSVQKGYQRHLLLSERVALGKAFTMLAAVAIASSLVPIH